MSSKIEESYVHRKLEAHRSITAKNVFLQWEWLLVLIFLGVMLLNTLLSPYFFNVTSLRDATMIFLDKSFIVFPMAFIMIMREIDISVGSTVALSSVMMATAYNVFGLPMELAIVICLAVGVLCGLFNGYLITKFSELSAVIVTLGTMILYRGVAYIILEDQASGNFPEWFGFFGWGYVFGVPFIFIVFIIIALLFGLVLHKTSFGRRVYAIGHNDVASKYSGVNVTRIKLIVYMLAGLMAAVTAVFLASRMGSTRPNIANAYELDVIAMAALGGISTAGGKGRLIGTVIAIFIVGYLQYGLGLINIPSQTLMIVIGGLLLFAVIVPKIKKVRKL